MPKTTKTGSKKSKPPTEGTIQVQLYLPTGQVGSLDRDRDRHEKEVQKLMGSGRRVSRSAHGGSIFSNYLRCRESVPDLSYADFWRYIETFLGASQENPEFWQLFEEFLAASKKQPQPDETSEP